MKTNDRVDAYIAQAASFAQPMLLYVRALMQKACPEVEATIEWLRQGKSRNWKYETR